MNTIINKRMVVLVMAIFVGFAGWAWAEPIPITTCAELQNIQANLTADYVLMNDINCSSTYPQGFVPIGIVAGAPFQGIFDGQGYAITDLYIYRQGGALVGLFSAIGQEGKVRNVRLVNARIFPYINKDASIVNIGSLVGLNKGLVENCSSISGQIDGDINTTNQLIIGGLAGRNEGVIVNSLCECHIKGRSLVGGLVGFNNGGTIRASSATGYVEGQYGSSVVGGLVGKNAQVSGSGGVIDQSFFMGNILGSNVVGGLVGENQGPIQDSFSSGSMTAVDSLISVGGLAGITGQDIVRCYAGVTIKVFPPNPGDGVHVGGLVGQRSKGTENITSSFWDKTVSRQDKSDGGTGLTTEQMRLAQTFQAAGWTPQPWYFKEGFYPLLSDLPEIPIKNCTELQNMKNNKMAYYVLMNDIDCSDTVHWNEGKGFEPVGSYKELQPFDGLTGEPFKGVLNGEGHYIKGLYINRNDMPYVGLFGAANERSWITDVHLVDVDITSGYDAGFFLPVASLVGVNRGIIEKSSVSGSVKRGKSTNEIIFSVGGLVGFNEMGTIRNSYYAGHVTGYMSSVGGLIGWNAGGSVISSSAVGVVRHPDGWNINKHTGGLIGSSGGYRHLYGALIENSFFMGDVFSNQGSIGGVVGFNDGMIRDSFSCGRVESLEDNGSATLGGLTGVNLSWIINSYSASEVISRARDWFGGLVGDQPYWADPAENSFWDMQMSIPISGTGTGLSTEAMQTPLTFMEAGWETPPWSLKSGRYPQLTGVPQPLQRPWFDNENGELDTDSMSDMTMGYHFVPQKQGVIYALGGFFCSTKTVCLWEEDVTEPLKCIDIDTSNNWKFAFLPEPVNVKAGTKYTVSAYMRGNCASVRYDVLPFPQTYGDIKILGSTKEYGNARPFDLVTDAMYGQVDIGFVPTENPVPVNQPPVLNSIGNKTVNEGQLLSLAVSATDPNPDDVLTYTAKNLPSGNLPPGATFTNQAFSWTPAYNQSGDYTVIFTVTDSGGLSDSETITIHVNNTMQPAKILTPAAGTILHASPTFTWDAGIGVTKYSLKVAYGATVIYGQELGTSQSATVSGLPLGQRVAVKLGSFINGTWYFSDCIYQVGNPARIATPAGAMAKITPNAQATLLDSPVTFTWDAGVGVSKYSLKVTSGTTVIFNKDLGTSRTSPALTIPLNGQQVSAELTSVINGKPYSVTHVFDTWNWTTGLGPQIITNGDFSQNFLTGWTATTPNWKYDSVLKQIYIASQSTVIQMMKANANPDPALVIKTGRNYQVDFDVKAYNGTFAAGGTYFTLGGKSVLIADVIGATSQYVKHYKVIIPATTTANLQFVVPSNKLPSLAIDNVSVKEYRTPTPQPSPSPSPTASPNTAT